MQIKLSSVALAPFCTSLLLHLNVIQREIPETTFLSVLRGTNQRNDGDRLTHFHSRGRAKGIYQEKGYKLFRFVRGRGNAAALSQAKQAGLRVGGFKVAAFCSFSVISLLISVTSIISLRPAELQKTIITSESQRDAHSGNEYVWIGCSLIG